MTLADVTAGIVAANYHRAGIRCLRLMRITPERLEILREEVTRLLAARRGSDVTRPEHVTRWTAPYGTVVQYSLLNASGRSDDYSGDHDLSDTGKRFAGGKELHRLRELLTALPSPVNFRVNVLGVGAGLSPHEEQAVVRLTDGTAAIRARFHLPLLTGTGAELLLDGDVYHLEAGAIFFVNNGCVHAARNRGQELRAHLVWDVILARTSLEVMFGDGPPPAPWLRRVPPAERVPAPIRREAIGPVRRLWPSVREEEARRIRLQ